MSNLAMRATSRGSQAAKLPLYVGGLLASADRRSHGQTSSSLTVFAPIAVSDASKNVAENVPRLILFAMLASVSFIPCFLSRSASSRYPMSARDMNQALADFRELRELAALQFFDLFSLLRELNDPGTTILCAEVDSFSAVATGGGVIRYKLADPLMIRLAALRTRQVHSHKIEGGSCDF
jgi:hypothetical protein